MGVIINMVILGWFLYGLFASIVVYVLFPVQSAGIITGLVFLGLFMLLGGLDYFSSITSINKKDGKHV